jgi:hypothetical protein
VEDAGVLLTTLLRGEAGDVRRVPQLRIYPILAGCTLSIAANFELREAMKRFKGGKTVM